VVKIVTLLLFLFLCAYRLLRSSLAATDCVDTKRAMPAASFSRTTKRARTSALRGGEFEYGLDTPDDLEPTSEASASHLVSFLTGYDNRAAYNANGEDDPDGAGSSDEDPDPLAGGVDEDDDYDEDEDEEDDGVSTPTKRSRTGLVGTPGTRTPSSLGTPTPRKRRTGTTTPRKKKSATHTSSLPHDLHGRVGTRTRPSSDRSLRRNTNSTPTLLAPKALPPHRGGWWTG
jgi:hypothetical protein